MFIQPIEDDTLQPECSFAAAYDRGMGVGRGLGDGLDLGVGVGRGVAVAVGVGLAPPEGPWMATVMGEPVLKYPTVALTFCGG